MKMAWDRHRLERPKCKNCGKEMMRAGNHWICSYCTASRGVRVFDEYSKRDRNIVKS